MGTKYQGFLLFYDWCELMLEMSPKHCKMLLTAMYNYQIKGEEPPEFPDKIRGTAKLIFAQLRRRTVNAENGRRGGEASARRGKEQLSLQASPQGSVQASPPAYRQDKDKDIVETETRRAQDSSALSDARASEACEQSFLMQEGGEGGDTEQEGDGNCRQPKEGDGNDRESLLYAYGSHRNVYLTEAEYEGIKRDIPDADGYIDRFSEKLFHNGYRYRDCCAAIRSWWERDRELGFRGEGRETAPSRGSFDTDAFYQAAVAHSLGFSLAACDREGESGTER